MKRRILIFIWALLSLVFTASADNSQSSLRGISSSDAEAIARDFFARSGVARASVTDLTLIWDGQSLDNRETYGRTSAEGEASFYVFNRGVGEGFVIVSATDVKRPILAYAYRGAFSVEHMPANVRAWMRALRENELRRGTGSSRGAGSMSGIGYGGVGSRYGGVGSRYGGVGSSVGVGGGAQRMTGEVDLETPDYDQDVPYNKYCPEIISGWNAYPGCAITATTIVMSYHKWPKSGTGTIPKYRIRTDNGSITLGPIELGATYDWDNVDDIARVMAELGVMARATYKYTGTSARLETIMEELPKYYRYNPYMKYLTRSSYTDVEWKRMLRESIDARRPIVYDGYDMSSGHAIVVDGYNDQGYFNINWGWGGYCNGFYDLDHMNPDGTGIGGNASGGYNLSQGGIFEMRPILESEVVQDAVKFHYNQSFANGIVVNGMNFPAQKGDSFSVDAGIIRNVGTNVINNPFKLVMTDKNGNIIEEFVSTQALPLKPFETQLALDHPVYIEITQDVLPGYRLRVVFQSEISGGWVPVLCDPSLGKWEVLLADDSFVPNPNPDPNPDPDPTLGIEEGTSLRYNKENGFVTITTLPAVTVQIKEVATGKDLTSVVSQKTNVATFKRSDLEKGSYIIVLKHSSGKMVEVTLEL